MIDLNHMEQYRENNRIEAKRATGGLPHSIWETYSAFANTLGGLILLGVEEAGDKSLHVVDLPDPEQLVEEFWELVNDPKKASVNILSEQNVRVETVDGKRMIVISVPRAQRTDRPVYVEGNPLTGTYYRNGEGDIRCTQEEVQTLLRDADVRTQDMRLLEGRGMDALNMDSLHRYRAQMWDCRPGHAWAMLDDEEFLSKAGAAGRGADGALHPTGGGLLMFGYEAAIVKEFPDYALDYRQLDGNGLLRKQLSSDSGEETGNLYDFFEAATDCLAKGLKGNCLSERYDINLTPVQQALREALANSIINADYYGRQGVTVIQRPDCVAFSNPGSFRIDPKAARNGGLSDPRNEVLVRLFNLVNVGRRTGSGIPGIYAVWQRQGWAMPVLEETFNPDRITFTLSFQKEQKGKKKPEPGMLPYRELLITYLTDHVTATSAELSEVLGLSLSRTRAMIRTLIDQEILVAHGGGAYRRYQLKA